MVILDANVLYPFHLRDTMLRTAAAGFYQLRWSRDILDEMVRSLVRTTRISKDQATRLRSLMEENFPEALITGYEELVEEMENAPSDRHVTAAASRSGAQIIVTSNLKDFGRLPLGIIAKDPDEFLCSLFNRDPNLFLRTLQEQAADLRNPPVPFEELLHRLSRTVPKLIALARIRYKNRSAF
ncbi:MAG: PIN domain-containing protein [Planctomycetes bacterium]|nr:PIN domain-containing protein [Planctomycetota bacterium]